MSVWGWAFISWVSISGCSGLYDRYNCSLGKIIYFLILCVWVFSLNYLYNGTIVFVPLPCDKIFPEETQHKCLLNPDLVIHHRLKDKHGSPAWMSFIGVTYRNMGEELQEQKWLNDRCITKSTPAWVTAQKSRNLEHNPTESSAGWRVSIPTDSSRQLGWILPGSWSLLRIFLAASLHFVWEELSAFIALLWLGRPSESG